MQTRDNCRFRYCPCCKTRLYYCEECNSWYPRTRKDQLVHGGACRQRKSRAKKMVTDKNGQKYHLIGEVNDKGTLLVAVKFYDKSKRTWMRALLPKTDLK